MRLTLRARLALWAALATGLAVLLVASGLYFAVNGFMRGAQAERLQTGASGIQTRLEAALRAQGDDFYTQVLGYIVTPTLLENVANADPETRRSVELRVLRAQGDGWVQVSTPNFPPDAPLPGGRYDVVIGDLLYSQLLYPALLDAEVPAARRRAVIAAEGGPLTAAVVAALHASAPVVVHVHDPACWGNGYPQPVELDDVLRAADGDPADGLVLAARAKGPREADPRRALEAAGIPVLGTALWHWPFVEGVDYLVVGTVAAVPPSGTARCDAS